MASGVIWTITKLNSQLDTVAIAAPFDRKRRVQISAGYSHGIANHPMAKKVLNTNIIDAATAPRVLLPRAPVANSDKRLETGNVNEKQ